MHLPTLRARQRVEREIEHLADQCGPHPRDTAAQFLHDKIKAGEAGLDPWEPDGAIFLVQAAPFERLWAHRAIALTGHLLEAVPHEGGWRLRCVLEADVRQALGLDGASAPVMVDEPVPVYGVTVAKPAGLPEPLIPFATPTLQLVEADPELPAMRAPMLAAQRQAALRVDCACGAPAGLECRCADEVRLASPVWNDTPIERPVH